MTTIVLPKQIESRNKLDSKHWTYRRKQTQEWEFIIRRALAGNFEKATTKMRVIITSLRQRLLDYDNLVGGCKGLLDAMKRIGILVDDGPKWIDTTYIQETRKKPERKTVIEFFKACKKNR